MRGKTKTTPSEKKEDWAPKCKLDSGGKEKNADSLISTALLLKHFQQPTFWKGTGMANAHMILRELRHEALSRGAAALSITQYTVSGLR